MTTEHDATEPWTAWSSQQADAIAKMTDAWLSGAGAVRDLQLETAQQMRSWQAQAWQRAVEAKDVTDLMTLQAELLSFDGAHAGQYWGRLTDIASRTQRFLWFIRGRRNQARYSTSSAIGRDLDRAVS